MAAPGATVAAWSIILVSDWLALHPWGFAAAFRVGTAAFLAGYMLTLFSFGVLLYGLASREGRSIAGAATAILGVVILLVSFPVVRAVHRSVRHAAVARVETRARPLVAAIDAYARRHGHPPSSLPELVPTYVPNIPATGLAAFPTFQYGRPGVPGHLSSGTDDPWWIYVETPSAGGYDRMVYLPSGRYPSRAWGGAVVRIGTWAYVWE